MPVKKTKLMLKVEQKEGQPLEKCIPRLYPEFTLDELAERWGVSQTAVWTWILKLFVVETKLRLRKGGK